MCIIILNMQQNSVTGAKNTYTSSLVPLFCEEETVSMYTISVAKMFQSFSSFFFSIRYCLHHSPFPEGKCEFSTLWGMYVSGDTEQLQVKNIGSNHTEDRSISMLIMQLQLRDYPHPLFQGTNWRASGRIVFAEQEAQERGPHINLQRVGQLEYIRM